MVPRVSRSIFAVYLDNWYSLRVEIHLLSAGFLNGNTQIPIRDRFSKNPFTLDPEISLQITAPTLDEFDAGNQTIEIAWEDTGREGCIQIHAASTQDVDCDCTGRSSISRTRLSPLSCTRGSPTRPGLCAFPLCRSDPLGFPSARARCVEQPSERWIVDSLLPLHSLKLPSIKQSIRLNGLACLSRLLPTCPPAPNEGNFIPFFPTPAVFTSFSSIESHRMSRFRSGIIRSIGSILSSRRDCMRARVRLRYSM